jgi:hypothetical protein
LYLKWGFSGCFDSFCTLNISRRAAAFANVYYLTIHYQLMKLIKLIAIGFSILSSVTLYAQNFDRYMSASESFFTLMAKAETDKAMPRLADKDVAALITSLSDSQLFLDPYVFQTKDLKELMDVCGRANKIAMAYALFDLKSRVDPKASTTEMTNQVMDTMKKNIYAYQPELEKLQPFSIRCMAKQVGPMTQFMRNLKKEELTDVRKSGLRQARTGIFGLYYGVLQTAADPNIGSSFKLTLLKTLSDTSEKFFSMMQPQARQQIVEYIKSTLPATPSPFAEHFEKISSVMSGTVCEGLCSMD